MTITPRGKEIKTYEEIRQCAEHFAKGVGELGLCEPVEVDGEKTKLIGYFLENSWVGPVTIIASEYMQAMGNFIYADPVDQFHYISEHGMFDTVVVSTRFLDFMITPMEKKELRVIKNFVIFRDASPELISRIKALGATIYQFDDVVAKGRESKLVLERVNKDTKFLSICTSGSTGTPKCAVMTDKSTFQNIACEFGPWHDLFTTQLVMLNNLTLGFGTVLGFNILVLCKGGRLVYLSQPGANFFEDVRVSDPTFLCLAPIAYNKMYQGIQQAIDSLPSPQREGIRGILAKKAAYFEATHSYVHPELDKALTPFRAHFFGSNLRHLFNIGARLTDKVLNFFRIFTGQKVINIYGCVECTGIVTMARDTDEADCIGIPTPWYETKLVDIPEKNYTSKDVVDGKPCPRGELWVRGPTCIRYFNDPKKSAETLTPDGWLKTGDVVALKEDMSFRIIDRRRHIIKLTCVISFDSSLVSLNSCRWNTWSPCIRRASMWHRCACTAATSATTSRLWWSRGPTPSCGWRGRRAFRGTFALSSTARRSRTRSWPTSKGSGSRTRYGEACERDRRCTLSTYRRSS